jgi:hypothetical protein
MRAGKTLRFAKGRKKKKKKKKKPINKTRCFYDGIYNFLLDLVDGDGGGQNPAVCIGNKKKKKKKKKAFIKTLCFDDGISNFLFDFRFF